MREANFCPFIPGSCRNDCVFNRHSSISLNNGYYTRCQLMSFITIGDSINLDAITDIITDYYEQKQNPKK